MLYYQRSFDFYEVVRGFLSLSCHVDIKSINGGK